MGASGDRNFDKNDLVNNRFTAMVDMDLQYREDFGLFLRGRGYYDDAYDEDTGAKFYEATRDLHRDKVEILDAFAYSAFDLGGYDLSLRVGRQVVSWGESLFILGGVSTAQAPLDATAANAPGVELKDIFLPVGQVSVDVGLTDTLTFSTYNLRINYKVGTNEKY